MCNGHGFDLWPANFHMPQSQPRERELEREREREWEREGEIQTATYKINEQQGYIVQHREIQVLFYNNFNEV